MALVSHREAKVVGAAVAAWMAERTNAVDMRVVAAEHPSVGYSSETVMVTLAWSTDNVPRREHHEEIVVRLAPATPGVFRDYNLSEQVIAQRAAAAVGVAIATPELITDVEWLGVPFVVMPRVRGHIIGEVEAIDPWLLSLSVEERSEVHRGFVAATVATHRSDCAAAAGVPQRDNTAELDFWDDYLMWSSGGSPVRALVAALAWCRSHQPTRESEPVLLWGDARLGNVIFDDALAPAAVLDWDMTSIGAPEHDVAWMTMLPSIMDTLLGSRLAGFPDRDATISSYEQMSGRVLCDMEWYETLAFVRSTAIFTRVGYLRIAAGLRSALPIDDNPMLDLLRERISSDH